MTKTAKKTKAQTFLKPFLLRKTHKNNSVKTHYNTFFKDHFFVHSMSEKIPTGCVEEKG